MVPEGRQEVLSSFIPPSAGEARRRDVAAEGVYEEQSPEGESDE